MCAFLHLCVVSSGNNVESFMEFLVLLKNYIFVAYQKYHQDLDTTTCVTYISLCNLWYTDWITLIWPLTFFIQCKELFSLKFTSLLWKNTTKPVGIKLGSSWFQLVLANSNRPIYIFRYLLIDIHCKCCRNVYYIRNMTSLHIKLYHRTLKIQNLMICNTYEQQLSSDLYQQVRQKHSSIIVNQKK